MKLSRKITPTRAFPRLLIALAASVAAMGASAQAGAPQFKLLLGIVVEGLDDASLEQLRDKFGQGGFRMLADSGVYVPFADYGTPLDVTAATATVMSGAQPSLTGIDGTERFDRTRLLYSHAYADPTVSGIHTREGYSPLRLRVSTISDEARIAGAGISTVYAIAPTPGQAIALGGHAANAALWLDAPTGNWSSSAYYRDVPAVIATRNRVAPLTTRLDTMSWAPVGGSEVFSMLPEHLSRYPFRYVFPRSNTNRIDMFMASPLMNREVTTLATELISNVRIGKSEEGIDVLNIGYSLTPYPYGRNADKRLEQLDATLRLDANLEQLFSAVDRAVGLNHTLIYLAGTPARPYSPRDDERWNIPFGEFSTRRAASLLNMYLIALHGNGDYVSAFRNGRLYLNSNTIKDKGLDAITLRAEAAAFLARMSGVDRAYSSDAIASGTAGDNASALRRNTALADAPDVTVMVAPGYELIDDFDGTPASNTDLPRYVRRAAASTAPAFIFAPSLKAERIDTPVDARAIAPTVCRILRIRSPNGATEPPMSL